MADKRIQCPFCWEKIWVEFDQTDGDSQQTIIDCEVCCQPILYDVRFDGEGRMQVNVGRS